MDIVKFALTKLDNKNVFCEFYRVCKYDNAVEAEHLLLYMGVQSIINEINRNAYSFYLGLYWASPKTAIMLDKYNIFNTKYAILVSSERCNIELLEYTLHKKEYTEKCLNDAFVNLFKNSSEKSSKGKEVLYCYKLLIEHGCQIHNRLSLNIMLSILEYGGLAHKYITNKYIYYKEMIEHINIHREATKNVLIKFIPNVLIDIVNSYKNF
jgi:hypothetical protein